MRMPPPAPQPAVRRQALPMNRIVLLTSFLAFSYGAACAQSVTISWNANTESTLAGYKVYMGTAPRVYGTPVTLGKVTSYLKSNLAAGTYYFAVTAYNTSGVQSSYSTEVTVTVKPADTTRPTISGITVTSITSTGATVSWTTNEASDTQVEYGTTTSYGRLSTLNSSKVTSHRQSLTGLTANTTWYYRVKSRDAAGNLAVSTGSSFRTASAAAPATAQPAVTSTGGLRAAFTFNEGKGTASSDVSGNGNSAALSGTTWTTGRFGYALSFDGSTSHARALANKVPALNTPQTLSAYYFVSGNPSTTRVMLKTSNMDEGKDLIMGFRSSRLGVWNDAGVWLVSAAMPAANAWHHVAYVFDGKTHSLYLDGVVRAASTVLPGTHAVTAIEVGGGRDGTGYFSGKLDEILIYDRALPDSEINTLRTFSLGTEVRALAATAQDESAAASDPEGPLSEESLTEAVVENLLPGSGTDTEVVRSVGARPAPTVHFELSKPFFGTNEPVELSGLTVANPGSSEQAVELKTWLASSAAPPVSLGAAGEDGGCILPAATVSDFGPVTVLEAAAAPPEGSIYRVGSRMLDPVTGDLLSEEKAVFAVLPGTGAIPSGSPEYQAPYGVEVDAELGAPVYSDGDTISVPDLVVRNTADEEFPVQLKVWLETAGIEPLPVLWVGADGSLVLPAGSESHFYRPRDLAVTTDLPHGGYALRCRVLDPVTGGILADRSTYFTVR